MHFDRNEQMTWKQSCFSQGPRKCSRNKEQFGNFAFIFGMDAFSVQLKDSFKKGKPMDWFCWHLSCGNWENTSVLSQSHRWQIYKNPGSRRYQASDWFCVYALPLLYPVSTEWWAVTAGFRDAKSGLANKHPSPPSNRVVQNIPQEGNILILWIIWTIT